jgi:YgiT-type zinc finger domain-containing protein
MNCIYCQGKMLRMTAPFHIDRKGYHLLFDAIPDWVCSQCGKAYFSVQEFQTFISKHTPTPLKRGIMKIPAWEGI